MRISRVIKDRINTGHPIDAEKLIAIVKDYDVISFDIFDTLLKRNVRRPTDVFDCMEQNIGVSGFAKKRIEAEKKAREHSDKNEISLQDIYEQFGQNYADKELEIEADLLVVNFDMIPVFRFCIEHKRVVLVSDMYLPEDFIVSILSREGIIGYEKLYLSSTVDKTKSSGEMFYHVLNDSKIDINSIVHIGDSITSDYKVPREIGMAAINIPTHTCKAEFHLSGTSVDENIINSFINNSIPKDCDNYYRFGYEKFGMFLWGYSKWLHDSVSSVGINRIYFFSRDGLIMKKAFDILYSDVKTYYIEVSRRTLRVPVLWINCNFEHVLDMISPSKLVPIATIFDGVGLNIEDYKELVNQYGFKVTTCFDRNELLKNKKLIEMYKQLIPDIERISKQEYELLVKYIKQNNLLGHFAIVDIGWSGGMQRYLCETLDKLGIEHEIKGYYIGVADYYKRNQVVVPTLNLNGFLFDFSHDANAVDRRSPFVGLFETLFLEQAGSVKNYVEEDEIIKGNRLDYEYIQNGEPTHELKCVQKIQQGALDFVRRFGNKDIKLNAAVLFKGIEETGLRPTKKDIELFADFRFFDEGETQCLAKPKSILRYITHPIVFKKDFLLCRWKIGFMKRLLKVKLPYERMYRLMLKYK